MSSNFRNATSLIAAYALSAGTTVAFAHEGHGLTGSHWHPTDTLGFLAAIGIAAWAIWFSRKGK